MWIWKKTHARNESLCNESIDNERNHKINHHLFTDWKVIACAHLKVWDNLTDRESSVGWLPIEIKREINIHKRTSHTYWTVCVVRCVYLPVLLFEMCPGWCVPTSNEATTTCWAVDHSYHFNLGYCFHSVEYFRFSLFQHHRRQIYFYGQFSLCCCCCWKDCKRRKKRSLKCADLFDWVRSGITGFFNTLQWHQSMHQKILWWLMSIFKYEHTRERQDLLEYAWHHSFYSCHSDSLVILVWNSEWWLWSDQKSVWINVVGCWFSFKFVHNNVKLHLLQNRIPLWNCNSIRELKMQPKKWFAFQLQLRAKKNYSKFINFKSFNFTAHSDRRILLLKKKREWQPGQAGMQTETVNFGIEKSNSE